jgi:hypothetical protein
VRKRADWRRNMAFTGKLLLEAVESLLYRGGAHGIKEGNPNERAYRDVGAGVTHVGCDWDVVGRLAGQVMLGLPLAVPNFGAFSAETVRRD